MGTRARKLEYTLSVTFNCSWGPPSTPGSPAFAFCRETLVDDSNIDCAGPNEASQMVPLSRRELEILILACTGRTDKEIAVKLQIASGSVRTYWERMRRKCNAINRMHILALLTGAERMLEASTCGEVAREVVHGLPKGLDTPKLISSAPQSPTMGRAAG